MKDNTQSYFNLEEAADYLRVSPRFLRYQFHRQDISVPGIKIGRKWIFKKESLDQWAAQFITNDE